MEESTQAAQPGITINLRVTLGRTIQLHPSGISVVASPHPAEVHQVFPQNSGVPGSAVAVPPGRRVAPIPLADLLVSYSAPAERLSHFQAQGQVERLPDRHPAAHAVPVPILVPPGLPEGWLQIPGLPWLARRLGLLWVPVVCGHHSEGGPLRGTLVPGHVRLVRHLPHRVPSQVDLPQGGTVRSLRRPSPGQVAI